MPTLHELTVPQLRQALQIREQIESLQDKLNALMGGTKSAAAPAGRVKRKAGRPPGKRTMTPEARAKIAAAQHARWAKINGKSTPAKAAKKPASKKGGLTAEGRAKLAAAMKARWAARKGGAPALNSSAK